MASTAALVLVGGELLSGKVADGNRQFISHELRSAGVKTSSVHIVGDEVGPIADLVRHLSSRVTYVITVGGLGPTLDDITLEAVARAFGLTVVTTQPEDASAYARMSGSETTQPLLRHFPNGSEIISTAHGPVVRTHNVYSLPGLPRLVRARFAALAERLRGSAIHSRTMSLSLPQSHIARTLEQASRRYPAVSIGCYPSSDLLDGTAVTFEGSDSDDVDRCFSLVQTRLAVSSLNSRPAIKDIKTQEDA